MTIETLLTLSKVILVLAIILSVLSVVLFFVLDINKAWHLVTGKQIKDKKKVSQKDKKTSSKNKTLTMGPITDKIATEQTVANNKITQNSIDNATTILKNVATTSDTVLLNNDNATTLLANDGTTLLGEEVTTLLDTAPEEEFEDPELEIVEDITYTHTQNKI